MKKVIYAALGLALVAAVVIAARRLVVADSEESDLPDDFEHDLELD